MDLKLPVVTWHPNPLDPGAGRVLCYEPFEEGESIGAYILRQGWDDAIDYPARAFVGGVPVEKQWWLNVYPKAGTSVSIHRTLSGDDSDIGQVLMTVVIAIAAYWTGGAAAAAYGGAGTTAGAVAGGLASAAVMIGGSLLSAALFKPDEPTNEKGDEDKVYTIASNSNSYRHYEPVMLLCGRRRIFPDVDEKPYTYFSQNDQFLHQTFNFGLGNLTVSDHRIGETPIENLDLNQFEVGVQHVSNVDTSEGSELKESTGWVVRTSPNDTTGIEIDITGLAFSYSKSGEIRNEVIDFEAQYSPAGENAWVSMTFPPQVIGLTPSQYEYVPAVIDPYSGELWTPKPAGDGWELYEDLYSDPGSGY